MHAVRITTAVVLALISAAAAQEPERPGEAVRAIVSRETEFFEFARDHGRRAAFLEFLADDAVMFDPAPVNAKQMWTKRPEDSSSLAWQPDFAAVARACDIGYDTGPWEFRKDRTSDQPDAFGHFVSVWKKEKDGRWKVVVDYGVEHGQPPVKPPPTEMVSSDDGLNEPIDTKKSRKAARAAREQFTKEAASDSVAAFVAFADDNIRVYREGVFPAIGREAAGVMLGSKTGKLKLGSNGGGMSRTGDIGYDYGSYDFKRGEANEHGYYLQVWRTDATGKWKLAVDLERKLAPEEKKK
jgi:ketosteroid isomerase-like protein